MYIIKQIPEDFIVKELSKPKIEPGSYSYFKLKKTQWTTIAAIKQIAIRARMNTKFIGIAGNKDKEGITEQTISIFRTNKERIKDLKIKDIELEFLGTGKERINLGDSEGNEFVITIRNLDEELYETPKLLPDYFDDQRFGVNKQTHLIGKAIVKKDFQKAVELINDPEANEFLKRKKNDYVGAIRLIDKKMLRLYMHAYESYLWNLCVSKYLEKFDYYKIPYSLGELNVNKNALDNIEVPILGFLTEFKNKEIEKIYHEIMREEDLTLRDFVIRQIPELTTEGASRLLFFEVKNYKLISIDKDDLNHRKLKEVVSFRLPKGAYATLVIKYLYFKEKSNLK